MSSSPRFSPTVSPTLLAAAMLLATACESASPLPIRVIFPEESAALERADNAALVLQPEGESISYDVDGVDFSLELELEPDAVQRTLELYLAEGTTPLAWGATSPFTLNGPDSGLSIFLGQPGRLSTFPGSVPNDPETLAAAAIGRGMLLLGAEGVTYLLNEYSHNVEAASTLENPPPLADGGLFPASDGRVVRIIWDEALDAWSFDPSTDLWTPLEVQGSAEAGPRLGAATLLEPAGGTLYIFGGGENDDILAVDLQASSGGFLAAATVKDTNLDGPRQGATATWIVRGDNPTDGVLIFGGADPTLPLAIETANNATIGAAEAWTGAGCAQLRPVAAGEPAEILCLGGQRGGADTPDAIRLVLPDAETPGADDPSMLPLPGLLPLPMWDPMLFEDESALYAQGEAQLFRIDRADLALSDPISSPLRAHGGHWVRIATGATFLVGGVAQNGGSIDRWQVFTPALGSSMARALRSPLTWAAATSAAPSEFMP